MSDRDAPATSEDIDAFLAALDRSRLTRLQKWRLRRKANNLRGETR